MKKLLFVLLFVPLVSCVTKNEKIDKDKIKVNSTEKIKPLYVLDGIRINNGDTIPPSSILEIVVIKGQKAIDKYGLIGENGVIEITSK